MPKPFEQYLRTTLASIGDAVISTDLDGRVVFVNPVALKVLRAAEQDIVGRRFEEVFPIHNEFTHAKVENPLRRVLDDGVVVGLANHTVLTAFDGTEVPIDDSAAPVRDPNGELEGAVIVFRDVTERRRAEIERQLLASIVESSDDAIVSKDLDGIVTSWNKGAERIFGYTAEEMIGKPISIIAAPDRVDEMPRILERIRHGERVDHFETHRQSKDGRILNISLTVSPVHDSHGRVVGASKVARDITEQVRGRDELAEQRERLRVTLSSIGDAVIAADAGGRIAYMNPVAEALTAWETAEALGKPLEEVFRIVNEESRQTVENPVGKVLAQGNVVGLANHTVLLARDGREIPIDDSGAPIRNALGEILGVVLIFRDITERRSAEKQLEAWARQLRTTNQELSQFAFVVSHDLREPLRNIGNFTELLMREYPNREGDARIFADYIVGGVGRMEALLNDLLTYSQIGAQEPPAITVDTNEVVRKVIEDFHSTIEETGAQVAAGDLPPVYGHDAQIYQLFQNLIGNAIKYHSSHPPRVQVHAERGGHSHVFCVSDNGIGIQPEYHQTIFGVFKRLHGRDIPGTGIGLAICAKVVDRHHGRIWVESNEGEGSRFFFTLPAAVSGHAAGTG